MIKSLVTLLSLAAASYVLICGVFYLAQRQLIYYPSACLTPPPEVERETFDVGAARIDVDRVGRGTAAVLYFGGNAEQVLGNARALQQTLPDHSVYLLHYRGYGCSTGTPSEPALVADAMVVATALQERHSELAIIGRSLGSGVAMQVAARTSPDRMALVTPFDSLAAVGAAAFRWLPVRLLLKDRYESVAVAEQIETPTLVLTAGRDRIVPPVHAEALYAALPPTADHQLIDIPAADHNDLGAHAAYWDALGRFLNR